MQEIKPAYILFYVLENKKDVLTTDDLLILIDIPQAMRWLC